MNSQSRRKFFNQLSTAAAGAALIPSISPAQGIHAATSVHKPQEEITRPKSPLLRKRRIENSTASTDESLAYFAEMLSSPPFLGLPPRIRERLYRRGKVVIARMTGAIDRRDRSRAAALKNPSKLENASKEPKLARAADADLRLLLARVVRHQALAQRAIATMRLDERYSTISNAKRTAMAFGGGGTKGSFEVGALCYLSTRQSENDVRYVCGSSTGALNALAMSAGGWSAAPKMVGIYLGLQSESDMYKYNSRMISINNLLALYFGTTLDRLLAGSGGGPGLNPDDILTYNHWWVRLITYTVPVIGQIISTYILWEVTDTIETKLIVLREIIELLKEAESIYTLSPVRSLIENSIDFKTIGKIPLRMATIRLEDGKTCFMDEAGNLLIGAAATSAADYVETWALEGNLRENLLNGAIASASIPGAFAAQQLRVNPWTLGHFVDGGIREMIPMKAATDLGVQRIIAILASPVEASFHLIETSLTMGVTLGRSIDLMTNETALNDHSPPSGWNDEIERILIFPMSSVHEGLVVDPGLIRINIAYGYMRAHDLYLSQTGQLNIDACVLIMNVIATEAIIELRSQVKKLEEQAIKHLVAVTIDTDGSPDPSQWTFDDGAPMHFDKVLIDEVRELKHQILKSTENRFLLLGSSLVSLPISIQDESGEALSIYDWWNTWEKHPPAIQRILDAFDLWTPLPIGENSWNLIVEASVRPKPTTSLF